MTVPVKRRSFNCVFKLGEEDEAQWWFDHTDSHSVRSEERLSGTVSLSVPEVTRSLPPLSF
jgi:hypothetical protein